MDQCGGILNKGMVGERLGREQGKRHRGLRKFGGFEEIAHYG